MGRVLRFFDFYHGRYVPCAMLFLICLLLITRSIAGVIISPGDNYCIMPELIKRKCRNPDAYLDEQDVKDIAEAEDDIRQGRVFTTKELRARLGIQ
jgi:hypothetical protein